MRVEEAEFANARIDACALAAGVDLARALSRLGGKVPVYERMLRTFVQIMRSGRVGRRSLGSLPKRLLRQWLEEAGFANVAHVVHGFEGELNEQFKRSSVNGWRFEGLPWEQM